MPTRLALLGIIIEDISVTAKVNELLHTACDYIVGRMGVPYKERAVNIISVVIDAPHDIISTLAGKLGAIRGVNVKAMYSIAKDNA